MGYHINAIPRGTLGEPSKIAEEFYEFCDAVEQNNKVMAVLELSDLLGAIDAYVQKYNLTLNDLVVMMSATKSAFEDGTRISKDEGDRQPLREEPRTKSVYVDLRRRDR